MVTRLLKYKTSCFEFLGKITVKPLQALYQKYNILLTFLGKPSNKRRIVNLLIFLTFVGYFVIGGIIFYYLEYDRTMEAERNLNETVIKCSSKIINNMQNAIQIFNLCFAPCHGVIVPWSFSGGIIFAFASITTIGYGTLKLITHSGRIFYIVYCMIGMPLGLMFIGNLGQFMEESVGYVVELMRSYRRKRRKAHRSVVPEGQEEVEEEKAEETEEEEFEIGGLLFLALFFIYTGLGVTTMCILLKLHVIDGVFINFSSLTAVEAGDFFSFRGLLLPISLTYVTGGLALATVAIRLLGVYLKKLHNFGKKLKQTGNTKIWFGGKSITVKSLISTLGDQVGVDQKDIDNVDLDKLIAGKLQPPPPPPSPPPPTPPQPPPPPPTTPKGKKLVNWTANKSFIGRKEQNSMYKVPEPKNIKIPRDPVKLLFEATEERLKKLKESGVIVEDDGTVPDNKEDDEVKEVQNPSLFNKIRRGTMWKRLKDSKR